jgi:hypothetical protein
LLTAGLLMSVAPRPPWSLVAIPILWTIVGGSAAFLLGVWADLGLIVAGLAMLVCGLSGGRRFRSLAV